MCVTDDTVTFPPNDPLNRYRANARLDSVLGAPDLVPNNARADMSLCPNALGLRASVTNAGAVGVPPGIPVAFYRLITPGPTRELVGATHTTKILLPGGSEPVEVELTPLPKSDKGEPLQFEVVVDDDGTGTGQANECREDNNAATFAAICAAMPR